MSENPELKTCPFCGEAAKTSVVERTQGTYYFTGCHNSECEVMGKAAKNTLEHAISAWNTRAEPTYTTEKPSELGWYWYRESDKSMQRVIRVYQSIPGEWEAEDGLVGPLDCYDGEWAGPILEPKS